MSTFKYEAMDSIGQPIKGNVEAVNSSEAIAKVRAMGNFPTKIKEMKSAEANSVSTKIKVKSTKNKKYTTQLIIRIIVGLLIFGAGVFIGLCI